MRSRTTRLTLALLALLTLLGSGLFAAPAARAAGFVVINTNDAGAGSLRQALADAAAAAGADTITFQTGVAGTIILASTLTINQDVTITGPGATSLSVIAGGTPVRLFTVTGGSSKISGLTITKGGTCAGGGNIEITTGGALTLENSVVSDNRACNQPLIYVSNGTLTVTGTTISGSLFRGIEAVNSTLAMTNSTISGSADQGIYALNSMISLGGSTIKGNNNGGIYAHTSPLAIIDSTISGNVGVRGGLWVYLSPTTITGTTISGNWATGIDEAAGINILDSAATITNSTISGNQANFDPAGLQVGGGASLVNLRSVTLTGNVADFDNDGSGDGGGIRRRAGGLNIQSSIVAGNLDKGGQENDCVGNFTSLGNSIFGSATDCPNIGATDLAAADINAVLVPTLASNGGPTQTHALVAGSPAINAGATTCTGGCPPTDQRGIARPQGPQADIGAVEAEGTLANPPVTRALAVSASGPGTVSALPAPNAAGGRYGDGTQVTIAATPNTGSLFTGWTVNGQPAGYATPLVVTMNADHTVVATFGTPKAFCDVNPGDLYFEAIRQLSARNVVRGFTNNDNALCFGATDKTLRAQMAALIARPFGWDTETNVNTFTDRGPVDDNLWASVAALQAHRVAFGYTDATCVALGLTPPCYGPTDNVLHAQVISFITRGMVEKGYWQFQADSGVYPNVRADSGHRVDIATYVHYAGALPGADNTAAAWADWDQPARRNWFAEALWRALSSYFRLNRLP